MCLRIFHSIRKYIHWWSSSSRSKIRTKSWKEQTNKRRRRTASHAFTCLLLAIATVCFLACVFFAMIRSSIVISSPQRRSKQVKWRNHNNNNNNNNNNSKILISLRSSFRLPLLTCIFLYSILLFTVRLQWYCCMHWNDRLSERERAWEREGVGVAGGWQGALDEVTYGTVKRKSRISTHTPYAAFIL